MSTYQFDRSCEYTSLMSSNGVFEGEMPLEYVIPRLAFQLTVLSLLTLAMQVLLRPLGQTRYVSNLIGGLILGPTVIGRIAPVMVEEYLFPERGTQALQIVVQLGLCFWYFLMGAQIHVGPMMKNVSKKAACIGMTSVAVPLLLSYSISFVINKAVPANMQCHVTPWFLGLYFITTTISVLAGNVIDHELLGTELGNLAMTSAIFTSVATIFPLNATILLLAIPGKHYAPQWKFLSGGIYLAFLFVIARPVINLIYRRLPNEEDIKEHHVCGVLLWAIGSATLTEALGAYITLGAFMSGLVLPHGALTTVVIKRVEDFNTTLLMPPFFAFVGLSTNLWSLFDSPKGWTLVLILLTIYLGKVGLVALTAATYHVNINEGMLIGFLMCSKGILDILLLFWTTEVKVNNADPQDFAIMVVGIVATNLIIGPAISYLHERPMLLQHKGCRAIQELRLDSEIRILACLYDQHSIPILLSLVKASHATKMSPINLSALHLVHATSRESTVQQQSLETGGLVRGHEAIGVSEAFKLHKWAGWVTFSLQTKLSSYSAMPEHICKAAESGHATILIIPFHIKRLLGSHAGVSNDTVRNVNLSVLEKAPCSVGVLVDMSIAEACPTAFRNVAVLFFGGPHDREASCFALRMADQESVRLTVVRFKPVGGATTTPLPSSKEDDLFIDRFKSNGDSKISITYMEKFVSCGADMVTAIRGMNQTHELFIVGRRHGPATAQMLSGLEAWSEHPELGAVGDLLVSPDFSAQAVLVVQQYSSGEDLEDEERDSCHDFEHGGQTYRYVLHEHPKADVPSLGRENNMMSHNGVKFDEYGWNWNLRAGF